MLIQSVDFIIHQSVNSEGVVFFVHQIKFITDIIKLVLHGEEPTADH